MMGYALAIVLILWVAALLAEQIVGLLYDVMGGFDEQR